MAAETGFDMDKIKKALFNSRITIMLLCLFVGTKLPIAVLQYSHLFHMVSNITNISNIISNNSTINPLFPNTNSDSTVVTCPRCFQAKYPRYPINAG